MRTLLLLLLVLFLSFRNGRAFMLVLLLCVPLFLCSDAHAQTLQVVEVEREYSGHLYTSASTGMVTYPDSLMFFSPSFPTMGSDTSGMEWVYTQVPPPDYCWSSCFTELTVTADEAGQYVESKSRFGWNHVSPGAGFGNYSETTPLARSYVKYKIPEAGVWRVFVQFTINAPVYQSKPNSVFTNPHWVGSADWTYGGQLTLKRVPKSETEDYWRLEGHVGHYNGGYVPVTAQGDTFDDVTWPSYFTVAGGTEFDILSRVNLANPTEAQWIFSDVSNEAQDINSVYIRTQVVSVTPYP